MVEQKKNTRWDILYDIVLLICTFVLLFIIYFQKWTDFWVLFFIWIPLGSGVWFFILAKLKPQMQLLDTPLSFNPLGDERASGRIMLLITLINCTILMILGWDSIARYQLMDNYGFLYVIPIITSYNLGWMLLVFKIWQNSHLLLKIPENRVKILHHIDFIYVRNNAKIIMIFGLVLEILVTADIILANITPWNMWRINLRTPGYLIDAQGQIPLSGLVWILLIAQPLISGWFMKNTFEKSFQFSLTEFLPTIKNTITNERDLRKIIRTIILFQESGPKNP